jgi:hypothetical protein
MKHYKKQYIRRLNKWEHFENWVADIIMNETIDEENDETRDFTPQDLLNYLKTMKFSVNDCLKMKEELPSVWYGAQDNKFIKVCDQRIKEIRQGLMGLWVE